VSESTRPDPAGNGLRRSDTVTGALSGWQFTSAPTTGDTASVLRELENPHHVSPDELLAARE
jgi:hypothetical protein